MGWYIPFHKLERLNTELDRWEYLIRDIPKIRWFFTIYILSVACSFSWVFTHPHIYKGLASKILSIFLGGLLGLAVVFFILPFITTIALILIWIVLNLCSILHKLLKYILD